MQVQMIVHWTCNFRQEKWGPTRNQVAVQNSYLTVSHLRATLTLLLCAQTNSAF